MTPPCNCLDTSRLLTRLEGSRRLRGDWAQLKTVARNVWPRLTDEDLAPLVGEREELMRILKARYERTYGQIEREVTEFELNDLRRANTSRLSLGIRND